MDGVQVSSCCWCAGSTAALMRLSSELKVGFGYLEFVRPPTSCFSAPAGSIATSSDMPYVERERSSKEGRQGATCLRASHLKGSTGRGEEEGEGRDAPLDKL